MPGKGALRPFRSTFTIVMSSKSRRAREDQKIQAEYGGRDFALSQLGFSSYQHYLKSFLWAQVRSKAFEIHGRECFGCRGKATQIHHSSYVVQALQGDYVDMLYPICGRCHRMIEYKADRKVAPSTATKRLKKLHKEAMKRPKRRKSFRMGAVLGLIHEIEELEEVLLHVDGNTTVDFIQQELAAVSAAHHHLVGDGPLPCDRRVKLSH